MKCEITKVFPHDIIFEREAPCISIYMSTHRTREGSRKDLIKFKNIIQSIEKDLLRTKYKKEVNIFLKTLHDIENDRLFWNKTKDGLVILINKNRCVIYILNREVEDLYVISDSFHIKPLVRVFQSTDKYYVLGLNRKKFVLYYGDRYGLKEISFNKDMGIEDILGNEYDKPYLSQGRYGKGGEIMFHGHGGKKEDIDKITEKYFRYIDKLIMRDYTNFTNAPLILVGLSENQGIFRKISKNENLLKEGIDKDFEILDEKEIRKYTWEIIEKFYLEKNNILNKRYKEAESNNMASDNLEEIVYMAVQNRVKSILISSDKSIPGKINIKTGEIEKSKEVLYDDILDDLVELVFSSDGDVVMLPNEKMPTETGLAAVFRY